MIVEITMKTKSLLILSLVYSSVLLLSSCNEQSSSQPNAVIQMEMMFDMGWEDVVEVKNCGSNEEMALEVIEGLHLVSQKYGRISRTYRIKP